MSVSIQPVAGSCIQIRTEAAQFDVLPTGYVRAALVTSGRLLSLDEPGRYSATGVVVNGKEVRDFTLDCSHATVAGSSGRLGLPGKGAQVTARSKSVPLLEERIAYEVYDDFPGVVLSTVSFRNSSDRNLNLAKTVFHRQRLNAAQAGHAAPPFKMWSFQGSSEEWGRDDVVQLSSGFSRENRIQQLTFSAKGAGGAGGGIPVVAFWTASVGEAFGQLDTFPIVLSMPVYTAPDGRVMAAVRIDRSKTLQAGETYSLPTTFLTVYRGDYFEPLRTYSEILKKQGWAPAHPTMADYQANWCGWGYQLNFTRDQIIGTIPKIKQLGIGWATLDAGWYDDRGDWNPRSTLGEQGIQSIVDAFHRAGLYITLWWIPLAVEDGGKDVLDGSAYKFSVIARQHPDWLILDRTGKRARMAGRFATLCPAVPEVRSYYAGLARRFIHDWGFDGNKLDFSYTVPPCYNPRHHHKSPRDSVRAVSEVYRAIFETTRALKPLSVTQICPCGTTPSLAWLADYDQAVTADPVGSVQVRRRIKMYKALLGPQFPVYGDHVELTRVILHGNAEQDLGRDFASTIGTGGVIGTKFTWPPDGRRFGDVTLTPEKETLWKKWIAIYNGKMLSNGTFRNLYVYGYDTPEAYVIEKNGVLYYAFFHDDDRLKTTLLNLRGLGAGRTHIWDYETGRDYGFVDSSHPNIQATFGDHLLFEADKTQP